MSIARRPARLAVIRRFSSRLVVVAHAFCLNCVFLAVSNAQVDPSSDASPSTKSQVESDQASELEATADFKASIESLKPNDDLVVEAFQETSDGWSSDEVILQDKLNKKFLDSVMAKLNTAGVEGISKAAINWRLMTLRKAGKLKIKSTQRAKRSKQDFGPLSEIAMRSVQDKTKLSSDRIMADPKLRAEFDSIVNKLNPLSDPYVVRKAAFQLRKTRRLQPELISRLADWGREVKTFAVEDLRSSLESVNPHPGIYIFRDQTGYLYIGQTENLRKRMEEHLQESHNASLANYLKTQGEATVELHSFDPKSRAKEVRVRRAYESELIRSRNPKFNVLP